MAAASNASFEVAKAESDTAPAESSEPKRKGFTGKTYEEYQAFLAAQGQGGSVFG